MVRTQEEIMADPQASADEITTLISVDALLHPNCPEGLWWEHAAVYPLVAMRSPMFPLVLLSEPERWIGFEAKYVADWIVDGITDDLSLRDRQLLAADCIDHVSFICATEVVPPRMLVRRAVKARRQQARREIEWDDWHDLRDELRAMLKEGGDPLTDHDAGWRNYMIHASIANKPVDPPNMVRNALSSWNVANRPRTPHAPYVNAKEIRLKEALWQWDRLLRYHRRELP